MSKRIPLCHPNLVTSRREALRAQARQLINKTIDRTPDDVSNILNASSGGFRVLRGVDLRAPLEEKANDCFQHTKWTAFVNKAGTLIHVLPKAGDFHVRIPMFYSTNGLSDLRIEAMLASHLEGRLV
jgi:hypothetical protein